LSIEFSVQLLVFFSQVNEVAESNLRNVTKRALEMKPDLIREQLQRNGVTTGVRGGRR
jgi:hypothetical protein